MNPTPHDIAEYRICADAMPYVDRASFTALLDGYERSSALVAALSDGGIDTVEELQKYFDEVGENETKLEELESKVDDLVHAFTYEADNLEGVLKLLEDPGQESRESGLEDLRSLQKRLYGAKT